MSILNYHELDSQDLIRQIKIIWPSTKVTYGRVTRRAKYVRPEFVEKVKQSEDWKHKAVVPNLLAKGADIY